MRRLLVVLAFVAVLAAALSVAAAEKPEIVQAPLTWQQASITDGGELYVELCAVCHGVDGKGAGPAAEALAKPVPDLTMIAAHNDGEFPREAVEKTIRGQGNIASHGSLEMPIWGQAFADARLDYKPARRRGLAEQRIYNLTTYLETIQAETP